MCYLVPLQKEVCDFYSKDIKFVVGEVEVVAKDHAMLKDGQKISFDAAVLCTGAHYGNNPWKVLFICLPDLRLT